MRKTSSRKKPFLSVAIIGLLITAAACTTVASPPSAASQTPSVPTGPTPTPVPLEEIPRVSVQDSKTAFDNKAAVFVDVRSLEAYAAGHIAGALSIPLAEIGARMDELDPKHWIITYCT